MTTAGEVLPTPTGPHTVREWQRSYARRLFGTDLIVVVFSVFASQLARFGREPGSVRGSHESLPWFLTSYDFVSLIIVVLWMATLDYQGTRDWRRIGAGVEEYKRVADATVKLFGLLAILAFAFQWDISRGYLLVALPTGLFLLLLYRWLWRQWLMKKRRQGEFLHRAVIIGEGAKAEHVAAEIARAGLGTGLVLVDTITEKLGTKRGVPTGTAESPISHVLDVVTQSQADTVILTGADILKPRVMRELGWELAKLEIDLVVAPALTDVAGPRIHARPVAGLPLIHVDYPRMKGRTALMKRAFDIAASLFAIVVLAPLVAVIMIAVKSDGGPVFFKQERVGWNHSRFQMLKFRSMVPNAEDLKTQLEAQSQGNGILFKMKEDPRITKVGGFLRKYSLDELPQFINVLKGDMSLVGPRPPLPKEVEQYDDWAHRRLLVKPGITGLWQIQGRSDLSWDDSIRLDLYYVENWSLTGDVIILFRTVRAVFNGAGAY